MHEWATKYLKTKIVSFYRSSPYPIEHNIEMAEYSKKLILQIKMVIISQMNHSKVYVVEKYKNTNISGIQ